MARWKGNQVYPYFDDVERAFIAHEGDVASFLNSPEYKSIMKDLYNFRSTTDPKLFPKDRDDAMKAAIMQGWYNTEIGNLISDPDNLQNRLRVSMERAKTDEEKKKLREEYDRNTNYRIFDAYQRTGRKERLLMMKKKREEEEYPCTDVLTMP